MIKQEMHAEEVTVKILVPDGYEAVDFKQPNLYETYLNCYGKAVCKQSEGETGLHLYWILKRKDLTGWKWIRTLPDRTMFVHDNNITYLVLHNKVVGIIHLLHYNGYLTEINAGNAKVRCLSPSTCEILFPKPESEK